MSTPNYRLIYWPIAGRGEYVRVIFEFAGVPFEEMNEPPKAGFGGGMAVGAKATDSGGFPLYAVPALEDREASLMLCQTPIICKYLGEKLGLMPERKEDYPRAEQVNATLHDCIGEGRLAFHGRNFMESYYTQKEETKPYIAFFIEKRLPRFLVHFAALLDWAKGKGWEYTFGTTVSYVDLGLVHTLRALVSSYEEAYQEAIKAHPNLVEYRAKMEGQPTLAAYFKSDRCRKFEGNSCM